MKQAISITSVELDVVNPVTGEVFTVDGKNTETVKYYSIRSISTRINQMDYNTAMATIITSAKHLNIMAELLDMVDADNRLVILNQTKLAEKLGCSLDVLKRLLKKLGESELAIKETTGLYHINPYIYIGKRTRSNAAREQLQAEWTTKLKADLVPHSK